MTAIRPSAPIVRVAAAKRAQAAPATAPARKAATVQAKPAAKAEAKAWDFKRIAKAAGIGVGAYAGGSVATAIADLFFHFGNNGGTSWPGGVYITAAGLAAAGAVALYAHLSKD